MKNFNLVPLCLVISALFLSCTKDDNLQLSHNRQLDGTVENGVVRNIRDFIYYSKFDGIATKAESQYTLDPYVYKGDTIMYVANYAGGGWELLSADYRAPIVLVSSESGSFDRDHEHAPSADAYLSLIKEDLISIRNRPMNNGDIDSSWRSVKLFQEDIDPAQIQVAPRAMGSTPGNDGEWVLLNRSEPQTSVYLSPRATITNWGQDTPWNMYVPYAPGGTVHCVTGCASVAVSQYLYALHYKTGNPSATVTSATYNVSDNTYSYSGHSASAWDLMILDYSDIYPQNTAAFIGYVGKSCETMYGLTASATEPEKALAFLNSFGNTYAIQTIDFPYVFNEIGQGYPVIANALCSDKNCNDYHTFIIDGYEKTTVTHTNTYGWVGKDNNGNDTNDYDEDGNVIGYSFTYDHDFSNETYKVMMNWGYDGLDRDVKYTSSNWRVNSHNYTRYITIFKRMNR